MGFSCGLVGLPNAGKSTLFNALTAGHAEVAGYPFTTITPHVGVVPVPDPRLDALARGVGPERVTPTTLEFVDIAGLVKGASQGAGLGNQFLGHIREVDLIAHVVRCFQDGEVAHVEGEPAPARDMTLVNVELALADLETVRRSVARLEKAVRAGEPGREGLALCHRLAEGLERGVPARALVGPEAQAGVRELHLLTGRPMLYVANVGEADLTEPGPLLQEAQAQARDEGTPLVAIAAKLEAELATLPAPERQEYLEVAGLKESGLHQLVRLGYDLLGLVTFFTLTGKKEVRAWTVPRGTRAAQAGGRVHSDFERGFIKAEVIAWEAFLRAGSEHAAREEGAMRLEGREYEVHDGDVIHFRFHA